MEPTTTHPRNESMLKRLFQRACFEYNPSTTALDALHNHASREENRPLIASLLASAALENMRIASSAVERLDILAKRLSEPNAFPVHGTQDTYLTVKKWLQRQVAQKWVEKEMVNSPPTIDQDLQKQYHAAFSNSSQPPQYQNVSSWNPREKINLLIVLMEILSEPNDDQKRTPLLSLLAELATYTTLFPLDLQAKELLLKEAPLLKWENQLIESSILEALKKPEEIAASYLKYLQSVCEIGPRERRLLLGKNITSALQSDHPMTVSIHIELFGILTRITHLDPSLGSELPELRPRTLTSFGSHPEEEESLPYLAEVLTDPELPLEEGNCPTCLTQ